MDGMVEKGVMVVVVMVDVGEGAAVRGHVSLLNIWLGGEHGIGWKG